MGSSKSSHRQCPRRHHRPPHTQNTGIHLAFPWVFALLLRITPHKCAPPPHLTLRAFLRNHLLLHTKRVNCALPPPMRCPAHVSSTVLPRPRTCLLLGALLRTIAMHRLLLLASHAPCAQPLLRILPPSSPLAEPDEEALRPTPLPADSCRTAGIERNGSAQKSPVCCRVQQTSPRGNSGSFDCGRRPEGTAASPKPVADR
jgi:hypothetical protein